MSARRRPLPILLTLLVALCLSAKTDHAQLPPTGLIAGHVFEMGTDDRVPGVSVEAILLSPEETLQGVTNEGGTYRIPDAPVGVYRFNLIVDGVDFPVREYMDLRVGMPFVLESCFELDRATTTATVRDVCVSGFVEEARVAAIGSQRYLMPANFQTTMGADVTQEPTAIEHDEIECLTREYFPIVEAAIHPGDGVLNCRVYFRSDKYPDFYYVEMVNGAAAAEMIGSAVPLGNDDFRAILPKPSAETERLIYYAECVTFEYNAIQVGEFDPPVVAPEECEDMGAPPWFSGDPSIIIGATAPGLAAIPPGFQALGITGFVNSLGVLTGAAGGAAGGGIAAGTAVVIAGGVAGAAVGTGIILTGGPEASGVQPQQ